MDGPIRTCRAVRWQNGDQGQLAVEALTIRVEEFETGEFHLNGSRVLCEAPMSARQWPTFLQRAT
eukprot:8862925-Heterocapsa_arctica.AAC.1